MPARKLRSSTVALGPPKQEKYLPVITFRCPKAERDWLEAHVTSSGLKLSQVVVWAVQLGHELFRVLEPVNERVEEFMRAEGLPRDEALARIVRAGLAALEKRPPKKLP